MGGGIEKNWTYCYISMSWILIPKSLGPHYCPIFFWPCPKTLTNFAGEMTNFVVVKITWGSLSSPFCPENEETNVCLLNCISSINSCSLSSKYYMHISSQRVDRIILGPVKLQSIFLFWNSAKFSGNGYFTPTPGENILKGFWSILAVGFKVQMLLVHLSTWSITVDKYFKQYIFNKFDLMP